MPSIYIYIYIIHVILTATPGFYVFFLQNNNHQAVKKNRSLDSMN